jgi:hypothetical protein
MHRILVLACASLSFALLASPLAAQETARAVAEQLPPAPPMPPMPNSKVRWVDVGGHTSRARAKASPARHAASVKRDSKIHSASKPRTTKQDRASHKAGKTKAPSSKATASRRQVREDKPKHFSAKTIRSCHAMTYRQILRNSSCRAMIKQELAAPAPKRSKAALHSKTTRKHSTARRRGR